jgi:tRNA-2-methylthio-N6-dimethylallyladenosine synthase
MDTQNQYFTTMVFGCQMNTSDSERLSGQARLLGYTYTEDMEQADLILISTCCVRESAELKIYGKIGELKHLKQKNPNMIIVVSGCMVQKDREQLLKKASHIDLLLGTHNLHQMGELIQEVKESRKPIVAVWEQAGEEMPEVPTLRRGGVSAWVPIMYGCNNFCTYCIVPYVRGRERSRPITDIIKEIQELLQEGFKEVTLLGQNVNSYGTDLTPPLEFAVLLEAVDHVPGIERIRYMTSHPRDASEQMIETVRTSEHICNHFHLPIQSGSDEILKRMNRGYTTEAYVKLVEKIRQAIPDASITTDLIVGFPGETETHFQETVELVKKVRFDVAYTFLYSKRSGTPAATMEDQVPQAIKKDRLQRLMNVQNEISLEINKQLEGTVVSVLVEGNSKNDSSTIMGRTSTNKIVLWKGSTDDVSKIVQVKIQNAQTWVLKGEQIVGREV